MLLQILFCLFSVISAIKIEGSLNVPAEVIQKTPDFADIFYKDVVVHLEGSPGTSKIAYPLATGSLSN